MFNLGNLFGGQTADNAVAQQAMAPIQSTGINAPNAGANMAPIATPGTTAAAGAATNTNPGFWQEGGGAQIGLGAIQTLGSLWNSFQQQKMAKKTFNLNKRAYENNLNDQRSTYNSALEDRIRSRGAYNGASEAETNKIIEERSL